MGLNDPENRKRLARALAALVRWAAALRKSGPDKKGALIS